MNVARTLEPVPSTTRHPQHPQHLNHPQHSPHRGLHGEGLRSPARRPVPVAVRVAVVASDPITGQGLATYLATRREITVLEAARQREAQVVLMLVDTIADEVFQSIADVAREADEPPRFVLIGNGLHEAQMTRLVSLGMVSILDRRTADFGQVVKAVLDLRAGRVALPPDAVGWLAELLRTVQRDVLEPNGLSAAGLSVREIEVLGLLADGLNTAEVAERLNYSERTVKNVIQGLMGRLNLRNRAHAVAFAIRTGAI